MSGLRVLRFGAENVKRIEVVELEFGADGMLVIGGNNGAGKSSAIDSLLYCLAGARSICEKPVRNGAASASAWVDLGAYRIRREWKADGRSRLEVCSAEGVVYPSPQALLDGLLDKMYLDPVAFMEAPSTEQYATVAAIAGLDLTSYDAEERRLYDSRRDAGRKADEAAMVAARAVRYALPADGVPDADALAAQLDAAVAHNTRLADAQREITEATRAAEQNAEAARITERRMEAYVAEHERRMEDFRREVETHNAQARRSADQAARLAEAPQEEPIDVSAITAQLRDVGMVREWCAANRRADIADSEAAQRKAEHEAIGKELEAVRKARADAIAAAPMPVEGMTLQDGKVLLDGVPLAQLSSGEAIRVGCHMALRNAPKLPLLFIRSGSLLDAKALEEVARVVKEHGAQCAIERVGDGKECTVIIEDGRAMARTDAVLAL